MIITMDFRLCIFSTLAVCLGLHHRLHHFGGSSLIDSDDCPTLSGKEEAVQLERFWRLSRNIDDP